MAQNLISLNKKKKTSNN